MSRPPFGHGDSSGESHWETLDEERPRAETANPKHEKQDKQEENAPTSVELAGMLKMATHMFNRLGAFAFSDQNLSFPRIKVLMLVAENSLPVGDYPRMHDIAQELGVTPRNITTIVDGLEHEGLLMRRPDLKDRRAIRLELTLLGQEQIEHINQLQYDMCDFFFAPLDSEQRQQLWAMLKALNTERSLPDEATCSADRAPSGVKRHLQQLHELHGRHRRKHGL